MTLVLTVLKVGGLICFAGIFILYYLLLLRLSSAWLKMPAYPQDSRQPVVKISVVLPVRNEGKNIQFCLESFLHQSYPTELRELIVVDDDSGDNTFQVVTLFKENHPECTVRLIRLEDDQSIKAHKKRALTAGISMAGGELIVTTDGDCTMGPEWLSGFAALYEEEHPELIIGPVAFHQESTLFGKMQTLEFAGLLVVTGASASLQRPLMCSGANLCYTQKVFDEVGGFIGDEIASGDDVLLMQKIIRLYPSGFRFLKAEQSLVWTTPQKDLTSFLQQRTRWASKFKAYGRGEIQAVAVLVYLCNLFLLVGAPICFLIRDFIPVYLILLAGKLIIDFLFLFLAISFLRRKEILWLYLIELLVYPFYVVLSGFLGVRSDTEWKGRKI
jgi:biofilm PGA synthesis N-glycosyltransferase PgaC